LWGGLAQKRRGYVHRSNLASTGYLKQYRYDNVLRNWNIGLFDTPENEIEPAGLDFGEVLLGDTSHRIVSVTNGFVPIELDSVSVHPPFAASTPPDTIQWVTELLVSFTPTEAGAFYDTLRFKIPYYDAWKSVPLSGSAQASNVDAFILHPSSFSLSAYPNPFNSTTTLRFTLPAAGRAALDVFDLLGRHVATLLDEPLPAGEDAFPFDASSLPSGLYFARLRTLDRQVTFKMALVR